MRKLFPILLSIAGWPFVAVAQGVDIMRPVDPSKPRDGFGFGYEMTATVSGTEALQRSYPTITAVHPGTPAEKAGIKSGDVILAADGRDLMKEQVSLKPVAGTRMVLRIKRGADTLDVPIVSVRLYTPPDSLRRP